jgi:hypothetical protein
VETGNEWKSDTRMGIKEVYVCFEDVNELN